MAIGGETVGQRQPKRGVEIRSHYETNNPGEEMREGDKETRRGGEEETEG